MQENAEERDDPSRLTVSRIYADAPEGAPRRELQARSFGPVRWLDRTVDGSRRAGLTSVEDSTCDCGGKDIVWLDVASGEREILVTAEALVPAEGEKPLGIDGYQWTESGARMLLFTNAQRVWRQKTRGDYWVVDLGAGTLRRVGGEHPETSLMFAKFSPDGERVAYVSGNDLWVEAVATLGDAPAVRLTEGGSRTLIHGTFDWVYEEEFSLRDGFRWSPDGREIAFWQLDASGIEDFHLIDNLDSLYPKLTPIPYPKVGTQNSRCRLGVVPAGGGDIRWVEPGGDEREHYIARMDWVPGLEGDEAQLVFQRLNRLQNTNEVTLARVADLGSGDALTVAHTETDEAWLDVVDRFVWLPRGDDEAAELFWLTERSGWRHMAAIDRSDGALRQVTQGDWDVMRTLHVDAEGGWVYFLASPESATRAALYRARLSGGETERLSPETQPGTHAYDISPSADYAIHTYSAFGVPPRIALIELPSHREVRVLEGNGELREKIDALALGETELFRVDIGGGISLDAWRILPPDFDPQLRYPVLFHVYGEPAGQTVLDRWGGDRYLWHQMLAQRGYVVVSVDNRGTPGPRGRAWRKVVYRKIGIIAPEDQAAAAKKILEWPFVDRDRVAIWGWSGGGSMTLNMLFRYPEIYGTGMSIAPVSDQLLYDTIYQERYMGLPEENAAGFRDGSPITHAEGLEGNLLLVHGTADDNVHYQSAERLIDRLIALGKPFDMMSYPNRTHAIRERKGTSEHLFALLTRYLLEHTPPGGQPAP